MLTRLCPRCWLFTAPQDYAAVDASFVPYLMAARQGDVAMLRCLRRLRYPVDQHDATVAYAVEDYCRVEVLQWLADSGFPIIWQEMEWRDAFTRPPWRSKWSERSLWINQMLRRAEKRELEQEEEDPE